MSTMEAAYVYDVRYAQFTGKERDAETGLDYFEARYMSSCASRKIQNADSRSTKERRGAFDRTESEFLGRLFRFVESIQAETMTLIPLYGDGINCA